MPGKNRPQAADAERRIVEALVGPDLADDPGTPPDVRAWVRRWLGMPAARGIPRVVPRGMRELHAGLSRVMWRVLRAARKRPFTLAELRVAAQTELLGGPRRDLPWHDPIEVLLEAARFGRFGLRLVNTHVTVAEKPSRVASGVVAAWVARRYGARAGRSIERRFRESAPAASFSSALREDIDLAKVPVVTRTS